MTIPTVPAGEFLAGWAPIQGEHCTIIGPTGSGKTRLAGHLLAGYPYTVQVVTKPTGRDRSVVTAGAQVIDHWPPKEPGNRIVLWPKWRSPGDVKGQGAKIHTALDAIFSEGGWAILVDDAMYVTAGPGGSSAELDLIWYHGRSCGLSLLSVWPRPRWAPRLAYSAATHLFVFGTRDEDDAKALGQISGAGRVAPFAATVQTLARYECVYVNTRTGAVVRLALANQL
ncbi:MAG: hypothetical protein ACRDX8_07475 [Acidimicrobiales bacterium]